VRARADGFAGLRGGGGGGEPRLEIHGVDCRLRNAVVPPDLVRLLRRPCSPTVP
jgi:hypothetical protein